MPSLSGSRDFGTFVEIPFFINSASNYDLTLTPRFSQKQDPLLQADWRHLTGYGTYELRLWGHQPRGILAQNELMAAAEVYDFRGGVIGDGNFNFGGWQTKFHLEDSTDDLFLRRYKFTTNDVLESSLSLFKKQTHGYWSLAANHYRATVATETDEKTVDAIAPRVIYLYTVPGKVLGGKLSFTENFTHTIRKKGLDVSTLDTRLDWQRLITTDAGWHWQLGNALAINALHYPEWEENLAAPENAPDKEPDKEYDTLAANAAYVTLAYPLGRRTGSFFERLEPKIQLIATSNNERYDRKHLRDLRNSADVDLSPASLFTLAAPGDEASRFNYGLRYRINYGTGLHGEIFAGQSHNLSDRTFAPESGYGEKRSAIVTETALGYGQSELRQILRIDEETGDRLRDNTRLKIIAGAVTLTADYTHLLDKEQEELAAGFAVKPIHGWSFEGRLVEDITNKRRAGGQFVVTYKDECLRANLTIERDDARYGSVESETTVRLEFELLSFTGN